MNHLTLESDFAPFLPHHKRVGEVSWQELRRLNQDPAASSRGRERFGKFTIRKIGLITLASATILAALFLSTPPTSTSRSVEKPSVPVTTVSGELVEAVRNSAFQDFLIPSAYLLKDNQFIKQRPEYIKEESEYILEQVKEESTRFQARPGAALLLYSRVSLWDKGISDVVSNPRLNIPPGRQEHFKRLLKLLVAVESGGDPRAVSNHKAYGLGQIKMETAKQVAQISGIKSFNLFDPKDNLFLSAAYLQTLSKSHPALPLVLTEYNLGAGVMIGVDKAFLQSQREQLKVSAEKVDRDFELLGADGLSHPGTWVHELNYEIGLKALRQSPAVQKYLQARDLSLGEFGQNYFRMVSLAERWGYIPRLS